MNIITRVEAAKNMAEKSGITHEEGFKALDAFLDHIHETLREGGCVKLYGFGTWTVKTSKPRVGRNPSDPKSKSFVIPPKPFVRFRVGKQLKESVRPISSTP